MEKGIPTEKASVNPYWKMHRDIQDAKQGLMTFEELRQAWVSWAKHVTQELESQAEKVNHSDLPDPNSADTTA